MRDHKTRTKRHRKSLEALETILSINREQTVREQERIAALAVWILENGTALEGEDALCDVIVDAREADHIRSLIGRYLPDEATRLHKGGRLVFQNPGDD